MKKSDGNKVKPAYTTQTIIRDSGGSRFYTNGDGTVQGPNGETLVLVAVDSKESCKAADSKPSSYTHAGALREAANQISHATGAPCAADQNKHLKRAAELISYVEGQTRQR